MKKEILDEGISINSLIEDGDTIDGVIGTLEFLRKQIKPEHTRHEIEKRYNGFDGTYELYLQLYRLESDEEYSSRLGREKALDLTRLLAIQNRAKKRREEQEVELAEYKILKAKYPEYFAD